MYSNLLRFGISMKIGTYFSGNVVSITIDLSDISAREAARPRSSAAAGVRFLRLNRAAFVVSLASFPSFRPQTCFRSGRAEKKQFERKHVFCRKLVQSYLNSDYYTVCSASNSRIPCSRWPRVSVTATNHG